MNNAIITIAAVFVTCPNCSADMPSPSGGQDWSLGAVLEVIDRHVPLECECGKFVTIPQLPASLPVNP